MRGYALLLGITLTIGYGYAGQVALSPRVPGGARRLAARRALLRRHARSDHRGSDRDGGGAHRRDGPAGAQG